MTEHRHAMTFNSPLETGVRAISILRAAYPQAYDLQRLVAFDHLVVHTGDVGGPGSLHPEIPHRSAELLVRRNLVERGLLLMISRGLVDRLIDAGGITYLAGELAETFFSTFSAQYLTKLRSRGEWVVSTFGELDDDSLRQTMNGFFDRWIEEFQAAERSLGAEK